MNNSSYCSYGPRILYEFNGSRHQIPVYNYLHTEIQSLNTITWAPRQYKEKVDMNTYTIFDNSLSLNSLLNKTRPDIHNPNNIVIDPGDADTNRSSRLGVFSKSYQHISNKDTTKLLLHFNGDNEGVIFTDSSANALTVTSYGVVTSSTKSKFGGTSAYFDNTYLTVADTDEETVESLSFGTGVFTIDFWVYVTGGSSYKNILELGTNGDFPATRFALTIYPDGILRVENFAALVEDTSTFPLNQWVHVAVTRDSSNVMKLFRNGTVVGSATISQSFEANMVRIGKQWNEEYFTGYIDELRIINGDVIYTSNFTLLTEPYIISIIKDNPRGLFFTRGLKDIEQ